MSRAGLRGPNRAQFELHSRRRELAPWPAARSTFLVRADAVITAVTYLRAASITVATKAQLQRLLRVLPGE